MSYLIPSSFSRYSLTDEEQQQANTFTTLNLQGIQNLICSAAEEKISLQFDPEHPHKFIQREAELQGQMGILQMLISMSVDANPSLNIVIHTDDSHVQDN